MTHTIRPATAADIAQIAEIYTGYVLGSVYTFDVEAAPPSKWETLLERMGDGYPFLVAVDGAVDEAVDGAVDGADGTGDGDPARVLGYAYVQPWNPKPAYRRTVENTIYLAADAAGRGLGSALLEALLDASRDAGIEQVIANIAVSETDASFRLHERFGFTRIGRLTDVGVKFGGHLDIELWQRAL